MFFVLCDNWKAILFVKVYRYSGTSEAPYCCFRWSQCFERSPYFIRYLHNSNMMLIPKQSSKVKLIKLLNFRNSFYFCHSFIDFSLEMKFFFINSKHLWKHVFMTQLLNKMRTKLKSNDWFIFPDYYTMLLSLLRRHWIQNIEQNSKLKSKIYRKTKDQNLVLPKE